MAKYIDQLETRVVSKQEVAESPSPSRKGLQVRELAQKFRNPETGQDIEIGEAVEFAGFDDKAEGEIWLKYIMPQVYKELGWNRSKKRRGDRIVSIEYKGQQDGRHVFWVVRLV